MRDISIKVTDVGDQLTADAFNSFNKELENIVTSADITLDPNAGPDIDLEMLGKAVAAYSAAGRTYQDSGSANAYQLSISSNLNQIDEKYYDGMVAIFKPDNDNTVDSTVQIGSLGAKDIILIDGSGMSSKPGRIRDDEYSIIIFDETLDKFILIEYTSEFATTSEIKAIVEDEKFISPKNFSTVDKEFYPIGLLRQFAGSTVPNNYLLCNGDAVSRTTYAALFSVIGTTFGVGDGSTTFNLPERGELGGTFSLYDTSQSWRAVAVDSSNKDVFGVTANGTTITIYKQTGGTGVFASHQTITNSSIDPAIAVDSSNGDIHVAAGTIIYKQTSGTGSFIDQSAPTYNWTGIDVNPVNQDVFSCTSSSGVRNIYKRTSGTGSFASQGAPAYTWGSVAVNSSNGDVYAGTEPSVTSGIHQQTGGTGSFVNQGGPTNCSDMNINSSNGDVWVQTTSGVYKRSEGTGSFILLSGSPIGKSITVNSNLDIVYNIDSSASDIYRLDPLAYVIKHK